LNGVFWAPFLEHAIFILICFPMFSRAPFLEHAIFIFICFPIFSPSF
jgi:hypothetical protein